MHCVCCNSLLTDYESTRKNAHTGEYLDMCSLCFDDLKELIPTRDRRDLLKQSDIDLEFEDIEEDFVQNMRWSDDS